MISGESLALPVAPPDLGQAVTDVATAWDARLNQIMRRGGAILALRGAGSTGGIDPEAADRVLQDDLIPRIDEQQRQQSVAIVYDGDPDDTTKPDIGYIFGRLRDRFDAQEQSGRISFLTAQADDWYYPPEPASNLANAHRLPIETFVFPRGIYPGDHNRFTQSQSLVAYSGYSQIYVGASGMLAADQMADYCRSVPDAGRVNVTVIRAMINQALSQEIGEKLAKATTAAQHDKLSAMADQRKQLYGKHWRNDGSFDESVLNGIRTEDETHKLVVVWDGPDKVDVLNCRKVDLNTTEFDEQFAAANYLVKTQPIAARQIPEGRSELVVVGSGATRSTANGGDWVCTSAGKHEEYVVYGHDFPSLYHHIEGTDHDFSPVPDPRKLVQLTEDVLFQTPWGEPQVVKRGGYVMERLIRKGPQAGQVERYGISQADAEVDFIPALQN